MSCPANEAYIEVFGGMEEKNKQNNEKAKD